MRKILNVLNEEGGKTISIDFGKIKEEHPWATRAIKAAILGGVYMLGVSKGKSLGKIVCTHNLDVVQKANDGINTCGYLLDVLNDIKDISK